MRYLNDRGVAFEAVPIRDQAPTLEELKLVLRDMGGEIRGLFNVSGRAYREAGLAARLPTLSVDEAFAELAADGNLVKRPFAVDGTRGMAGFDPDRWGELFVP